MAKANRKNMISKKFKFTENSGFEINTGPGLQIKNHSIPFSTLTIQWSVSQ